MEGLQRESFWDCVVGTETFESFKKNVIPSFKLKKEAPEEVVKSFSIVEKLLFHCYFEYDFLDPAMAKALASFEMALKIRYKEITGNKWNRSLQALTYYFNDEGYFEFYRKGLLDALRSTRNKLAHPENSFNSGFGLMMVFNHCIDLVNDLYEDRELRKERQHEKKSINDILQKIVQNGGMVKNSNKPYIVYDASIDFINNATFKKKYYGHFKMIFRLNHEQDEQNKNTDSLFTFQANSYEVDSNSSQVKFFLDNNGYIQFSTITKQVNQDRFNKWQEDYKGSNEDWVRDMSMNSAIDKQWAAARKELHLWGNFENSSERT